MNAPRDDRPDIRVGDLIKATKKGYPELAATGRVKYASGSGVDLEGLTGLTASNWDFEVLDRPLPPVEEELLRGATDEWQSLKYRSVSEALAAVINFTREYDRNNNKESK